jgi:hypothetical protein
MLMMVLQALLYQVVIQGAAKKTDLFSSAHRSAAERPGEVGIALLQYQHDAILVVME